MAVALDHPRTAERRHGEASFRPGTTTFSCDIARALSRDKSPPKRALAGFSNGGTARARPRGVNGLRGPLLPRASCRFPLRGQAKRRPALPRGQASLLSLDDLALGMPAARARERKSSRLNEVAERA
jgi:hypothetical protein